MKKSGCGLQVLIFVVTLAVMHFGWTAWDHVTAFLRGQGVPPIVLPFLSIVFGLWMLGAIMKGALKMSMAKTIRFLPSDLARAAGLNSVDEAMSRPPLPAPMGAGLQNASSNALPLDVLAWQRLSTEVEDLGFVHVMDFTVEADKPFPPGFARLFVNEKLKMRAELNQIFPKTLGASPTNLTCVFSSVLLEPGKGEDEQWSLETSDRSSYSGIGIIWAMRRPRNLWSRHLGWTPSQLLNFHLERRAAMERGLGVQTITDISWDAYCQGGQKTLDVQRKRLMSRSGIYIWWCSTFVKKQNEWWGDYKNASAAPS